ncbi:cell agglutination protein Mam3 [Gnomoniopsis smithogilvyi]|uniref:Cell agglutination protein Mam3 n=1 Tax=Gnomoniopsis smithogilvyi TaxID=1191159 RepID=A0A9W8YYV4_9PEZI|nr:cell agglutination protein Mam3 [Gnomoniopsis smithogilvyi]
MRQHHPSTHPLMAFRPAILALSKTLFAVGASAAPVSIMEKLHDGNEEEPGTELWILYVASMFLVLLGGAFAGLTIALMGQDSIYLQVIAKDPHDSQQRNAKRVFQLLEKGKHWVLVTLLLSNVIVNETLPVVLDRCLGGGVAAVIGSTVLIVIFGEVVPQSVCVRYGLAIGGYMSKPVLFLMYLMAPVAWPTAKLLDWALGEDHGTVYKKSGLKTLVTLHRTLGDVQERLNQDEVTIIAAVLDLKEKPVHDVMTPMDDVFVMSEDTVLDEDTIDMILSAGYSRIPIHEAGNPTNFIGMLLVKILITYDPEDCMKVRDFALATLPETRPETSCLDIINFFQEGKSHMVLVSDSPGDDHGALGVVTLEDVIEELIGEEIIDESDVYIDVHKAIRRMAPAPKARFQRRSSHSGKPIADGDDAKSSEDTKVGVEETRQKDSQRPAINPVSDASKPRDRSGSPMTSTLLLRRSSAGIDGRMENVPVRASFDDIKQHLKHLGPSNRASNPKVTRSTTVKIKPGVVVHEQPPPNSVADEVIPEVPHYEEEEAEGDETTSLLRGAITPKDGVLALAQKYGATGATNLSRSLSNSTPYFPPTKAADPAPKEDQATQTSAHASTTDLPAAATPNVPELRTKKSTSSSSEIEPPESGPYGHRKGLFARSGSITEQVVETRGIRKTVLGMTSSNEDEEEQHSKSASRVSLVLSPTEGQNGEGSGSGHSSPHGAQDDANGQKGGSNDNEGGNGNSASKKKNRRKKRKGKS